MHDAPRDPLRAVDQVHLVSKDGGEFFSQQRKVGAGEDDRIDALGLVEQRLGCGNDV